MRRPLKTLSLLPGRFSFCCSQISGSITLKDGTGRIWKIYAQRWLLFYVRSVKLGCQMTNKLVLVS